MLDVGCGTGTTTACAAWEVGPPRARDGYRRGRQPLVALARRLHADIPNAAFVVGDAAHYPYAPGSFDAVISRNGMMLFEEPARAFAHVRRAIRAGGRLAFATWAEAEANAWSTVPQAAVEAHVHSPGGSRGGGEPCAFSLADPGNVHRLLAAAGFTEVGMRRVDTRVWVGSDVSDVLAFFERSVSLTTDAMSRVRATLRVSLAQYAEPDGVRLPAAAWIVTARVA
ncbi:MAG: methyltransferase [Acidimicrobiia bacterium]|nr:MAG: methyltransferase [Acidimicrobiia bacterium]